MITSALKAYWKALLIMALIAALVVGGVVAWNIHGDTQYSAGYAQALVNQAQADELARQDREREKAHNDREAQERIEQARTDALDAADRAGRLQQQIAAIRKQLTNYTNAVGSGPATGDTAVLLADVLSQSIERNRQLADYADRAAEAGRTCERQYDSLNGTSNR